MLALVTCGGARQLDADLPLLGRELPEARIVVWDDPAVDWESFDTSSDLLPTPSGPVVLELEVTEPSLYLDFDERAPARAAAVFRSLTP